MAGAAIAHGWRFRDALPLTPREREVIRLIAEDKSTKQISWCLGISAKTVDSHRSRLMRKLDLHSVAGVVRYALRHGLAEL